MRPLVHDVPDPAERVLTALRRCASARLVSPVPDDPRDAALEVPLVHAPDHADAGPGAGTAAGTGDAVLDLLVVVRGAAPADGSPVRLEVLDLVRGGPADGRCRRLVVVDGDLTVPTGPEQRRTATDVARDLPDPSLLDVGTGSALVRLAVRAVTLYDDEGATGVGLADLATSGPDPFTDIEGLWLAHLSDPRCAVLDRIAARVQRCVPTRRPVLLGVDRAGLDLEIADTPGAPDEGDAAGWSEIGARRVRVPFAEDCVTVADLGAQIRILAGCPRTVRPLAGRGPDSPRVRPRYA